MPRKADYVVGSGNVFADLGLPNAEEMLAKAELAQKITRILARRRLTQVEAPTQPMRSEAASAGFYPAPWGKQYPRLQLLTVEELLTGKIVDFPRENVTFKKAPKAKASTKKVTELLF